jgi:hypothetical protein
MFFYKLLNLFYNDRILGQAGRKIGESVGSISRGPTPVSDFQQFGSSTFKIVSVSDYSTVVLASNLGFNTFDSIGLLVCLPALWHS